MTRQPTELAPLRMLVAVHEHGSLSAAADVLGVSQQGVSARMRALESQWGLRLFERSTRGTTLTPEGVVIAEWAHDLLSRSASFESAVDALKKDAQSHVRVAASLTVAEHLMPLWLTRFAATGDPARLELSAANSAGVIAGVRDGKYSIGFIETPDVPEDLDSMIVASDELVVVVGNTHAWASRDAVTVEELAATPLISRERGSGTRTTLERRVRLAAEGLTIVEPAAELPTALAIRSTVMAGGGVAVLSGLAVADDLAAGRLTRVETEDLTFPRPIVAVWDPRAPRHDAVRRLLDIARDGAKPS
ncbi:LysR family transcriptional regulator [Demequina aurantiaca]|uniref:LysR family transcriptional regulator n=1 Tax=Demequina aurantiaca TaxID=676200 RepID=UPI00078490D5|nr:LysR family transcriptional regulator [Demequina aurantiaca]